MGVCPHRPIPSEQQLGAVRYLRQQRIERAGGAEEVSEFESDINARNGHGKIVLQISCYSQFHSQCHKGCCKEGLCKITRIHGRRKKTKSIATKKRKILDKTKKKEGTSA